MNERTAGSPHPLQWAIDGKLPTEFWGQAPVLQEIYAAARMKKTSPDATLHSVLTRLSSFLPPAVQVDAGRGPTSLNFFSIGCAPSGYGKSTSWDTAVELTPHDPWQIPDFPGERPIGTGEGVVEVFMGQVEEQVGMEAPKRGGEPEPVMGKVRKQTKHNALFYVDEGETIDVLIARQGSVLGTVLRTAWNGGTLGQTNATEERTRYAAARSYSMGVMISWQPTKMALLFDGAAGGTPQRFMFCPATDPEAQRGVHRGTIRPLVGLAQHCLELAEFAPVLELPMSAMEESENWHDDRREGLISVDPLDGHAMLHRAKTAALLALLFQDNKVTEQAWDIAGQMWEASTRMRTLIVGMVEAAEREDRVKSGSQQAERIGATNEALVTDFIRKVAVKLAALVNSKPVPQPMAGRDGLWVQLASRDRPATGPKAIRPADVVEYGVEAGLFVEDLTHFDDGGEVVLYLKQVSK